MITHCQEITSYLLQFSQAFHASAKFLPGTDFGYCSGLLNSCCVPHLSGPPSILGEKKKKKLNPESEEAVLFTQCETLPSSFEPAGVT